ncbi:MAG: thioredoxin family protein [Ginsengibacter sp.]
MKKTLTALVALLFSFYGFSQNGRPAKELFQEASNKATKEHKNIFIIFTATWCGPCKYLKLGLYDVYNISYFEKNYVMLELYSHEIGDKISSENYGADSILAKYKGDTTAIPYWLILAPNGKKLHGELGFSNYPEELQKFIKVLKKTSHLSGQELQLIYDRFRQVSKFVPVDE